MHNADFSFLALILNASPVVQIVMGLLLFASILSWALIFDRSRVLSQARREISQFEDRFWSGGDLAELYRSLDNEPEIKGHAAIFYAGFREFNRLRNHKTLGPSNLVDAARRAMRTAMNRELDRLDDHLPFLATVGSTCPYIGLFGTVWGIMHAFQALGQVKQATLNLVAPGIAEALIATAMGLFAAIPAVIAYNRYVDMAQRLEYQYDDFIEEFSSILQRQAHLQPGAQ